MSVAFRRESDEEHLEPKFELPIPASPNLVTIAGKALIDARIDALTAAIAGAAADAVEPLRRDLRYWQTRRTTAVPTSAPADGSAGFGTQVSVRIGGRVRTIAIVGDDEADPNADRLAYGAPLARVLAGAEPGDRLPFNGREDAIEVLAVAPIDPPR
ncbi:GreA/GreB family elongation factor [Sphingomonas sp. A2-49]|uniref:GreA/GreB family elongation factor n=1 Tax=Sphingomonas sp. A2-49 TaxID=1391375 RepID=UPI0021D2B066|nr:GreA/GreB family elongation factor [Sphingomonas sp. A2-49]MCU6456008.1 GreA/GreB family elongation factor [Sphingomonas sp. A2-49]